MEKIANLYQTLKNRMPFLLQKNIMSHRQHLQRLIDNHNRRLQKLKEQKALQGISVDPKITIEIEDIEAEIERLTLKLHGLPDLPDEVARPLDYNLSYENEGFSELRKTKLVQSLIQMLDELTHRNEDELDALRKRSEMIIKKIFRKEKADHYTYEMYSIEFTPAFFNSHSRISKAKMADENNLNSLWSSGCKKKKSLFDVILEDIKL